MPAAPKFLFCRLLQAPVILRYTSVFWHWISFPLMASKTSSQTPSRNVGRLSSNPGSCNVGGGNTRLLMDFIIDDRAVSAVLELVAILPETSVDWTQSFLSCWIPADISCLILKWTSFARFVLISIFCSMLNSAAWSISSTTFCNIGSKKYLNNFWSKFNKSEFHTVIKHLKIRPLLAFYSNRQVPYCSIRRGIPRVASK